MEPPVEIRYAGVIVGRAQEVRTIEGDQDGFFLFIREPLPVGSTLQLRSKDKEIPARVVQSVEAVDPNQSGIQIRLIGAEEAATGLIPPPFNLEKFLAEAPPMKATVAPVRTTASGTYPAVTASGTLRTKTASGTLPAKTASGTLPAVPPKAASSDAIPVVQATAPGSGAVAVAPANTAGSETAGTEAVPVAPAKPAGSEAVPVAVAKSLSEALETATRAAPAKQAGRTTLLMGSTSDAVPVTVGNSVTDALYNATKSAKPEPVKPEPSKENATKEAVQPETTTKETAVPVAIPDTPSASQTSPLMAKPLAKSNKRGRSKKRK